MSTTRLLLAIGAAAVALYHYAPGDGLGAKTSDLPASLQKVPTAGHDPSWCGPVVSYMVEAERTRAGATAKPTVGPSARPADPAALATAASTIKGLPTPHRDWFVYYTRLTERATEVKSPRDVTAADRNLANTVTAGWTAMIRDLPGECTATAVMMPVSA